MKRLAVTAILLTILTILTGDILFSKERTRKKPPITVTEAPAIEVVTEKTDIHYTGKYCTECHEKRPEKGGDKFLKSGGDFSQLCRCHGYEPGNYIHPVDIAPSEGKKTKIPPDLPLKNGKVSCLTCHDIYMQCRENPELKFSNKKFLRGAPFQRRTDLCFRCHDEKKYKMLNPHEQVEKNGDIVVEKCLYCHLEKPDETRATFEDIKLIGDLDVLCQRCHGALDRHPANANHLLKPPAKTLATMKEIEQQFNIILPLDNEQKITCVTCHNPHERGVIPVERFGAKGAGEEFKHRLPGKICLVCHEK